MFCKYSPLNCSIIQVEGPLKMNRGMIQMLLFSYANWDEILQVCIGLCDDVPLNPGERTELLVNEPTTQVDKDHDVA